MFLMYLQSRMRVFGGVTTILQTKKIHNDFWSTMYNQEKKYQKVHLWGLDFHTTKYLKLQDPLSTTSIPCNFKPWIRLNVYYQN